MYDHALFEITDLLETRTLVSVGIFYAKWEPPSGRMMTRLPGDEADARRHKDGPGNKWQVDGFSRYDRRDGDSDDRL